MHRKNINVVIAVIFIKNNPLAKNLDFCTVARFRLCTLHLFMHIEMPLVESITVEELEYE